jgi:flagellar basal-body rod protein FlgC
VDYFQSFAISSAGMSVERMRVDAAAMNLANADTIQGADGAGYRPVHVVARAAATAGPSFAERVEGGLDATGLAPLFLPLGSVEPSAVAPRRVYEPGHPFADERGFVTHPGVDAATEMVTLMSALRAYEANLAALNTARTLVLKTLEIGGGP